MLLSYAYVSIIKRPQQVSNIEDWTKFKHDGHFIRASKQAQTKKALSMRSGANSSTLTSALTQHLPVSYQDPNEVIMHGNWHDKKS